MRNLIKKILFEEFHSRKIYIEEITLKELNSLIILNEGVATIECDKDLFKIANNRITDYYDDLNSFKYKKSRFTVNQTDHYCSRYKRKSEPQYQNNPNIYNPFTTEGIDLIFAAIPFIYDKIVLNDWEYKKEICFTIKTNSITEDGKIVPFTIAVVVNKNIMTNKSYRITLKTQIKGVDMLDKNYEYCGKYTI